MKSADDPIDAYAKTVHQRLQAVRDYSGKQDGDPRRAADAIIAIVNAEEPPLNLVLGKVGLKMTRDKLVALTAEIDKWEALTLSADFPEASASLSAQSQFAIVPE